MTSATDITVKVIYSFSFPPESVFDAWITGDKVRKWFAPGVGEMVRVAIDARVGGSFSFVQRRGLDDVDHIGTYLEFVRPSRLAFTWQVRGTTHNSRVFVDIVPTDKGCELTLVHELDRHWADYREKTAASWTKMLVTMSAILK